MAQIVFPKLSISRTFAFRKALAALALLMTSYAVEAADISARSPSRADVGAAVALARDGDVVSVPAGTATWTTTLNIVNNITIQGAGQTSTIIINGITGPSSRPPLLSISLPRNLPFRMTGFTFKGGVATADAPNGEIRISGNCHSFRIDHCTFDRLSGTSLTTNGFLWGVIDHCRFNVAGHHPITVGHATWNGKTYGNGSWSDDPYWGSEKFVFIEDNIFENATDKSAIDAFEGARFVVRHNQFHNSGLTAHGTEGQGRGTKQIEEYNNSYVYDSGAGAQAQIRSGSLITFNNSSARLTAGHVLQVYRPYHKSEHWGPVNGKNLYDQNDSKPVTEYWERGTHTGPTGSTKVVDSSKNWIANQWHYPGSAYMVRNITRETGSTQSYTWAVSNTSNTIVCSDLNFGSDPKVIFNPGDVYEIWKVDRALDQPGSGKTGLIPGLGNWPSTMQTMNQVDEPCYSWNNKDAVSGAELKLASKQPQIKEGRDFFNGTPKPGYTPYTYPHPLTGPAPPLNLRIVGP